MNQRGIMGLKMYTHNKTPEMGDPHSPKLLWKTLSMAALVALAPA